MANYTFQKVVVPGATDGTKLGGINNAGVVTGWDAGFGDSHYPHPFTYENGQISPYQISGNNQSTANGINSDGVVVGTQGSDPIGIVGYVRAGRG